MTLKVWTNDTDTVIAEDLADVRKIIEEMYGSWEEFDREDWHAYPDDRVLRIVDDEGDLRERGFATTTNPLTGHEVVARTCAEWIASEGRGFLCSTEY